MKRLHYGRRHTFPHRRITWRVRRARKVYGCEALVAVPGCATIQPGDEYVGVGIRPDEYQPRGWTHVKLCGACAAGFGLVDLELEDLPA